jgi:hypothetical protein
MASPSRRVPVGGEIRECANLVKVRVNDNILFVLGNVILSAGHATVVILTVAKVRIEPCESSLFTG